MYIFGKFEGFCKRLEKVTTSYTLSLLGILSLALLIFALNFVTDLFSSQITQMITAIRTFSVLSTSTIEGIDTIAGKFQNIYFTIKKKQYDFLAPRKADFEVDFAEFMLHIKNLEVYRVTETVLCLCY